MALTNGWVTSANDPNIIVNDRFPYLRSNDGKYYPLRIKANPSTGNFDYYYRGGGFGGADVLMFKAVPRAAGQTKPVAGFVLLPSNNFKYDDFFKGDQKNYNNKIFQKTKEQVYTQSSAQQRQNLDKIPAYYSFKQTAPPPPTPAAGQSPSQTPGSADAGPSSEDLKPTDPLSQFDPKLFGEKENFGSLKYPNSIESGQDRIIITQFQYKRSGVLQREGNFNNVLGEQNGDGTLKNVVGYVTLPMPNDISETNSVGWGEDSLSNIAAASMPALTGLGLKFSEGKFNVGDEITNLRKLIESDAVGARAKQFLTTKAAAGLIGKLGIQINPEAYITRATGAAINPNLELLFNGPKLRQFGFQFKMTPRDKGEADQIRRIIRFFKQGMSPRKGSIDDVAFFLGTPNVFKIQFKSGNSELKSIGKIKTCALVAFNANYTPDGFYAAYQDGAAGGSQPVAVSIQLGFTELTPIFNDEYSSDPDSYDDIGPNVLTREEENSLTVKLDNPSPSGPQGTNTLPLNPGTGTPPNAPGGAYSLPGGGLGGTGGPF